MKVAAAQMSSRCAVDRNLAAAGASIREAAAGGAEFVVLPENFAFLAATDAERLAAAEAPGNGPLQDFLAAQAAANRVWLVGGTVPLWDGDDRARSAVLIYDTSGRLCGRYDKIHLFDVAIPGSSAEQYLESKTTVPGTAPLIVDTPFGRIGVAVCYDLRFPALFHRLGQLGMDVLAVPAAFTVPTGRAHWQTLLKARAIESAAYVVAAAQCGEHGGGRRTWGHSMIVDPWGEVLAVRADGPGVVAAELDMMHLNRLRQTFPVLAHRREL